MARDTRSFELTYIDLNGHDNAVIIDKWPDMCPVCELGIEPIRIGAHGKTYRHYGGGDGYHVQAIFKCPREECQAVFIAYYTSPQTSGSLVRTDGHVFLRDTFVQPFFKAEKFDDEIEEISPTFIKVYTQAKLADELGLDLICGAGYRKALEFLIKDFLIHTKPEKEKSVKGRSLGWLIANEVESEKIKTTAGLAKDVGNDETHYRRKIEGLSLEDLRKLIKLTTHWVSDEVATREYRNKATPAPKSK